jgi:hypothetical protein
MKWFRYKKWFFDVLTSEETYIILFVSVIRVGWKHFSYLQLHTSGKATKNGFSKKISCEISLKFVQETNHSVIFEKGKIEFSENNVDIKFNTPELNCSVNYFSQYGFSGKPLILKAHQNSSLKWNPHQLKSIVNGKIQLEGQGDFALFSEPGYCDFVESDILPFKIPVRNLFWGRGHQFQCSFSWSVIKNKAGKYHSKIFVFVGTELMEFEDVKLLVQKEKKASGIPLIYPEKFSLKGNNQDAEVAIAICSHEEMIVSDFLAYSKKYGKYPEQVLRFISRNPMGIKFCATATLELVKYGKQYRFENLIIVDEFVSFYQTAGTAMKLATDN